MIDTKLENWFDNKDNYIEEYVKIKDLNEDLLRFAYTYSIFSQMLVQAKHELEKAEVQLTHAFNSSRSSIRDDLMTHNNKVTDKQLEFMAELTPMFTLARNRHTQAKVLQESVSAFVAALSCKKDMLVQLSANSRQEQRIYQP